MNIRDNRKFKPIKSIHTALYTGRDIQKSFKVFNTEELCKKYELKIEDTKRLQEMFKEDSSLKNCNKISVEIFKIKKTVTNLVECPNCNNPEAEETVSRKNNSYQLFCSSCLYFKSIANKVDENGKFVKNGFEYELHTKEQLPVIGEFYINSENDVESGLIDSKEKAKNIIEKALNNESFKKLFMIFYIPLLLFFFIKAEPKPEQPGIVHYRRIIMHKTMGIYQHVAKPDSTCPICVPEKRKK